MKDCTLRGWATGEGVDEAGMWWPSVTDVQTQGECDDDFEFDEDSHSSGRLNRVVLP